MQPADAASTEGVGSLVARAREQRGLTVDQVSERTRIRASLIRSIEADDFAGCGGAVYARGHIRGIARALDVDPEPLIARFDATHEVTTLVASPAPDYDPLLRGGRDSRRRIAWAPAMIGSLVVVCLLALVAVVWPDSSDDPSAVAVPAPSTGAVPSTGAAPPSEPGAGPATSEPTAPPTNLTVEVAARDGDSWLDVRVEDTDEVLVQRLLAPGEQETVVEARALEVKMGSAGAIALACNGQDLGSQGRLGQVVTVRLALAPTGACEVTGGGQDVASGGGLAAAPSVPGVGR